MKPKSVKNNLRVERARKYLSQEDLAKRVAEILQRPFTSRAVSNIENGVTLDPRPSTKRAIAQALDVPVEEVFPLDTKALAAASPAA